MNHTNDSALNFFDFYMTDYQQLGLSEAIAQRLAEMGLEYPTFAQSQFIPVVSRNDTNVVGLMRGNPAYQEAYGLPLLNAIDLAQPHLQAIVLCNTMESCLRVVSDLKEWGQSLDGLKVVALPGGPPIEEQVELLKEGAHIAVSYPGRLLDLITHGALDLHKVTHVVFHGIDDLMFAGQREAIDILMMAADHREVGWLLTSEMTTEVKALVNRYFPQARELTIHNISLASKKIAHSYYMCRNQHRFAALRRILSVESSWRGFIVCLTRNDGRELAEKLTQHKRPAVFIDGDIDPEVLNDIVKKLTEGSIYWVTLTDVAIRNLQLPLVSVMIHYGIPSVPEAYYQRCQQFTQAEGTTAISAAIITPRFEGDILDLNSKLQVKFEYREVPSPLDLTEARFKRTLDRLAGEQEVELPEHLLSLTEEAFSSLSKEELMSRVAQAEYRRLLDKAEKESDLNAPRSEQNAEGAQEKAAGQAAGANQNGNVERLFVNIGTMDGVTEKSFIGHLSKTLGIPEGSIGNIDLKRTHIHFDVGTEYAAIVKTELPKFAVNDRAIRVDNATPSRERKGSGPRGRKRRY